ncbi:MAG: cell division protein FtsA [Bacteroidaceae bacterium]|nr:cell division protein FtsA [Bacteroidaceae bacterium]
MATDIKDFIVTIDLGSSKVTAVAGVKQPDGAIKVLGFYQEPSSPFIRKGRISNIDKMTQCAKNIKEALEKRCKKSITKAYVGVGGMGMHTVSNTLSRAFSEKHAISQEIVDSLYDENHQKTVGDRNILEVIPQEYKVGTQYTNEPVGAFTDNIEVCYHNIVANLQSIEQIRKCFNSAGITVIETPITVLQTADLMLNEHEKRSGCVFIDMGAETTTVAIFKNNVLRHFAAIPLGGANITRDIMSLQLEEDEAETLKIRHGQAQQQPGNSTPITSSDGRKFEAEQFANIIEARVEEIVLNIKHQVDLSKYKNNQLIGGIIITGGASNLKGIEDVVKRILGLEKSRVAKNARVQIRGERLDSMSTEIYAAALALFEGADQNCCGGELGEEQPDLFSTEQVQEPAEQPTPAAPTDNTTETITPQKPEEAETTEEAEPTDEPEQPRKKGGFLKLMKNTFTKIGDMLSDD